jgi:hypothetical protein
MAASQSPGSLSPSEEKEHTLHRHPFLSAQDGLDLQPSVGAGCSAGSPDEYELVVTGHAHKGRTGF